MSNNPGKRGKPAPWVERAKEEREVALLAYQRANHRGYAEWSKRRSEAFACLMAEAGSTSPIDPRWLEAVKVANKCLKTWHKNNPNPMSWDDHRRLEAEFMAQYVPKDFS
ncbi:MAG: hypothetical protein E5V91_16040 [Mesorhizobium sp.]|nr:MAG: hypothetical protein E5V91_16040 [Mesorhizobium sp.]